MIWYLITSLLCAACFVLGAMLGSQRDDECEGERGDEALPTWEDLRGAAPNATGELSSEDFVRKQRDPWD